MNFKNSPHPYAAITIIFWSLAYVFTRLALEYFTAFNLGFLRYITASAAIVIIAIISKMKLPGKEDIVWFALSGCAGIALYMIFYNQGQNLVTASTASVVIASVPVITALLARFAYREKLRAYQWAAIAVEFAGVATLTLLNGTFKVNYGLFWLILASLSLSSYNLITRKLTQKYGSLQISTYSILFGTLFLSVFAPAAVRQAAQAPGIQFFYIAVLGVCSGAIAYACWAKAFSKAAQTSQVSNYMFITPFLASLLGFLIAGEVPDKATLIGGGIILLGVFIFNFGEKLSVLYRQKKQA